MNEDSENCSEGVVENGVCSASSKPYNNTVRDTDQEDPILMRKTTKALRNAKYSARLKQSVRRLDSALPMTKELCSSRGIVRETSIITSQLQDCLSNLLAKKPGVKQGDTIYNSAIFTLSHARASYARFLIDAENNIRSASELKQYLVDNVAGAASTFFSSLIQSCTHITPDICTSDTPTVATSACISLPSFVTMAGHAYAQDKQVSSEESSMECFELANGLEYSSVTTPCEQNGFCTPKQKEERIASSPFTPVAGARPRKQKYEVTPSTTPASVPTRNKASTPSWKEQKLYSPAGKKRLTFADATFQFCGENITADQLHNPKIMPGTSASHSSSRKFIPKCLRILSKSLSSSSEPDTCNSDSSRNTCFSQSSESTYEEPHAKRLCQSPNLKRSITPLKFKTCSVFNKDSFLLTNGCQSCDNRTHDLKFKEKEARPFKRILSYSKLSNRDRHHKFRQPMTECVKTELASNRDRRHELRQPMTECVKTELARASSACENSRISDDVITVYSGVSVIDNNNIASISTATDVRENMQQIFLDEVMYTKTDENLPRGCTTPDTLYMKMRNFSIQQEKCFNFLSENGEKKGSPVACCTLARTPPRYLNQFLPFNSPSDFLMKSVPTNTYESEDTSSPINYNSQEECNLSDDLKGLINQDLSPSLACSNLLPLMVDIRTSIEEDPKCKDSKTFIKLNCITQGADTLHPSSSTGADTLHPSSSTGADTLHPSSSTGADTLHPSSSTGADTLHPSSSTGADTLHPSCSMDKSMQVSAHLVKKLHTPTPKQTLAISNVQSLALSMNLEASLKLHIPDKQNNEPNSHCNIKDNDLCSYQQTTGNLQMYSDHLVSQDLQPSISGSCSVTPTQRLRIWSPGQPISQRFECSLSQEQIATPTQRLKINNVALSPSGMLETFEFESFITPVGRPYVFPIGAPRKASHSTSRRRPPQCRRSLARQFADEATRAASVVDTPPDSPVGFVDNQLLEMER